MVLIYYRRGAEQYIALESCGDYWVLQDGWAATPWQQLATASGSTFHQYFGMGDDEARPEAVVWVNDFGLRERVEAAWVAKRGGAAC